jgi:hypothetical protein
MVIRDMAQPVLDDSGMWMPPIDLFPLLDSAIVSDKQARCPKCDQAVSGTYVPAGGFDGKNSPTKHGAFGSFRCDGPHDDGQPHEWQESH